MKTVANIAKLEALYPPPVPTSLTKVSAHLTPHYKAWIGASRFCIVSTAGPEGTDATPRGDDGPVVAVQDDVTLLMPDWAGNNRLDTLRNIVRDGRVSLLFLVPGSTTVVRVNGHAVLTDDTDLRQRFARGDMLPRTVVVVSVTEVYFQCAKAVMRAGIWGRDDADGLPSAGDFLAEASAGAQGGAGYDANYQARAQKIMWQHDEDPKPPHK